MLRMTPSNRSFVADYVEAGTRPGGEAHNDVIIPKANVFQQLSGRVKYNRSSLIPGSPPKPAKEVNDMERVYIFERRLPDGVMPTGQKHFPRGRVMAVAVVEEYLRQIR